MSDEALSLSSELSMSTEGTSSSSKKAQKRKQLYSSYNVNKKDNFPKKRRKIQSESLDRNGNKKKVVKLQFITEIKVPRSDSDDDFQNFMKICLERRNDDDTKKVLQKLHKLYRKLDSFHKSDDKFKSYVNACYEKIRKNLSKDIYTPILELRTEIKNLIKANLEDESASGTGVSTEEVSEEKKRQIEQLEESIKKCQMKIKELEEKEVDFSQDRDSAYIQEDAYKKKLVQLCKCLSELSGNTVMRKQIFKTKIRRKDIPGEMTGILLLDEAVINIINSSIGKINKLKYLKTKGCADLVKMPDYTDVLQCIKKCNKDSNLDLSEEKMTKLAKRAFKDLGNFLKNKRINDSIWYLQSFIPDESEDPAEKNVELRQKLQKNKSDGDKRLKEIFKKYLDKENGVCEEEQTEEISDDDNKHRNETADIHSDQKNKTNNTEKDESHRKEKETLETNTIAKTSLINIHRILKSKETLKNKPDTFTASTSKETLKENIVTEVTSKSKETLSNNTVSDTAPTSKETSKDKADLETVLKSKKNEASATAPKSKENLKGDTVTARVTKTQDAVKDNTVIKMLKSKETLKNNTVKEATLLPSDLKNRIMNKQRENFEKTAQNDKEDDDVVIIDSSDDDCVEVENPCDFKKTAERKFPSISTKTEFKRIVAVDIESSQSISPVIASTPKTVAHNILPKKLVDVAKMDNSLHVKTSFIKVRGFAKSPPAWLDDGSIVESQWLSG